MTSKAVVALALVATQLLSGSASTLYACVSGNGEVCVDFGPDSCLCCQHDHSDEADADHAACTHRHGDEHACDDACAEHAPGKGTSAPDGAHQAAPDPCDCVHLLILQPRCTVRPSATADCPLDFSALVAPLAIVILGDECHTTPDRFAQRVLSSGAATLAARATTVIRC